MPFDVSEETLRASAERLALRYPGLEVTALVGDFDLPLAALPRGSRDCVAFLGSTIGNLTPTRRTLFLNDVASALDEDDWFLLGADLVKSPARLEAAYDDASGVTREFNLNVLHVLNRELGGDFDVSAFEHVARWNAEAEWMEMLRALDARPDGAARGARARGRVRRGRADAHRDQREVPPAATGRRARGSRPRDAVLLDRPSRRLRPSARYAPGKIRTCDLCLRRAALYPLSYGRGVAKCSRASAPPICSTASSATSRLT